MSLRVRIAVTLAVLAGVIASLASLGAYLTASRQLDAAIDETLITRATAAVSRPINDRGRPGPGGNRFGQPRCPDTTDQQSLRAVQLLSDGRVVACTVGGASITPTSAQLALASGDADSHRVRSIGDDILYRIDTMRVDDEESRVITMSFPQGGAIQLARDTDEARRVLESLQLRLVAIAALAIAVAAAVGAALATRIVRPIRELTAAAQRIASTRDLATPIPLGGNDEIGSLSDSFTTMVSSLAESRDQQQRLISDASHELRTPLTSLRTNLELLARADETDAGRLSAEDRRDILADLEFETTELTALLTELVELATDRSGADDPVEPVDLGRLAVAVAARAERRTGRDISVVDRDGRSIDQSGVTVVGRPPMLERAVSNLVDNAVKYSPAGAAVTVVVDGGSLEVRDLGPGIAPEDLPRIFDRFYRATSARTEPGSGLGLAIVSQVVAAHGGRVFASNHTSGAVVGFELPVSAPA